MKYNTDINIIGSIPDYHLIYVALPLLLEDPDKLGELLVANNEYGFRTEKSRKRFLTLLKSAFVNNNTSINQLTASVVTYLKNNETEQAMILFWLFSINNRLFYELNRDVFLKSLYQGRAELPKEEVIAYIKDVISRNDELKDKWSELTIGTIASKYLTVLKKLHLLEGVKKKKFCYVRISDELLTVFIHLYKLLDNRGNNILNDEFLKFSFVSTDSIIERLKRIGKKDWIQMSYTGSSLSVDASFEINKIVDGIFR